MKPSSDRLELQSDLLLSVKPGKKNARSWLFAASLTSLAVSGNMASLRLKFSVLWFLVVLTAHMTEAMGKLKMIGDEAASEFQGNTVMLRSGKTSMADGPEPGDLANPFTVRTLDGEFSYEPGALRGPLIIHAFTNKSGFLECLWSSESSLTSLVQDLPESTQVLFLSLDDSAVSDALWMRDQVQRVAIAHRCPERSHCFQAKCSGSNSNTAMLK